MDGDTWALHKTGSFERGQQDNLQFESTPLRFTQCSAIIFNYFSSEFKPRAFFYPIYGFIPNVSSCNIKVLDNEEKKVFEADDQAM